MGEVGVVLADRHDLGYNLRVVVRHTARAGLEDRRGVDRQPVEAEVADLLGAGGRPVGELGNSTEMNRHSSPLVGGHSAALSVGGPLPRQTIRGDDHPATRPSPPPTLDEA